MNHPLPDDAALERNAEKIVDEAHRIAKEKGRNIYSIMKELISDLKKEK